MINYLIDVSINTPIAQLPSILTKNNQKLRDEFDYFYDSSNNRLIRTVYVPEGSVTAHFGDFVNITCETLNVQDSSSLVQAVNNAMEAGVSHNALVDKWSDDFESMKITTSGFCHDAATIVYYYAKQSESSESEYEDTKYCVVTLKDMLDDMRSEISDIQDKISASSANVQTAVMSAAAPVQQNLLKTQMEPEVYDKSMLSQTFTQLRKLKYPLYRIYDLQAGKQCAYYQVDGDEVVVSDKYLISLETKNDGDIVNVRFKDTKTSGFYEIMLSRENGTTLKMSKNPLNRLQLKSVSYSVKYGTEWDIYQYSVISASDIAVKN